MFARFPSLISAVVALKGLITSSAVAHEAYCSYSTIQMIREMDASALKDALKNHTSHSSSSVSAFVLSDAAVTLIGALLVSGAWEKMTATERAAFCVAAVVGAAGVGYSMAVFGVEQNTLAAGMSAAVGVLALSSSAAFALFATRNRIPYSRVASDEQVQEQEQGIDRLETQRI